MSSLPSATEPRAEPGNRRAFPRHRFEELVYVDFGKNNGGMLVNVSEGGLNFQSVRPLEKEQLLAVEFMLPGISAPIQATGRVAWLNDSGKFGGLGFVDLQDNTRQQIREWRLHDSELEAIEETLQKLAQVVELQPSEPFTALPGVAREEPNAAAAAPADPPPMRPSAVPAEVPSGPNTAHALATSTSSRKLAAARSLDVLAVESRRPRVPPLRPLDAPANARVAPQPFPPRRARTIPATFIVASGCFVLLAAIAGMLFYANLSRQAAPSAAAAKSPANAGAQGVAQSPASPTVQTFQVEVVESNDKRWVLTEDKSGSAAAPIANPPLRQAPVGSRERGAQKSPAGSRQWPAQPLRISPRAPEGAASAPDASALLTAPQIPTVAPNLFSAGLVGAPGSVPSPPDVRPSQANPSAGPIGAVLIQRLDPHYSMEARRLHLEGSVQVSAVIGKDGVPHTLKLVNGNSLLGSMALNAIRDWRYKPALLNGQPIEQPVLINVTFRYGD